MKFAVPNWKIGVSGSMGLIPMSSVSDSTISMILASSSIWGTPAANVSMNSSKAMSSSAVAVTTSRSERTTPSGFAAGGKMVGWAGLRNCA